MAVLKDILLIVPLSLASHVTIVVDALPVILRPPQFAQNASLAHSLAGQPVFHVINPAFSAAAVQKIAYLACMENTQVEETASHALKTVLFAQMLQIVLSARRDQFWLE